MGATAKKKPAKPDDDLTLEDVERLEDQADVLAAREAIEEMERAGREPGRWEDLKRRLRL